MVEKYILDVVRDISVSTGWFQFYGKIGSKNIVWESLSYGSVLVIYFSPTNYHKFNDLKITCLKK